MRYLVYGRDRPGSYGLKLRLSEEHWTFMDDYAERLVARGPTLTGQDEDAEPTGSLHIVDLPDADAARTFAYDEPYYRAGVFGSVLLCRYDDLLGRTMWDFADAVEGYGRFLVLTLDQADAPPVTSKHLIMDGGLLALDGDERLGRASLVEAPDREAAVTLAGGGGRTEVHHWAFGGRPSQDS